MQVINFDTESKRRGSCSECKVILTKKNIAYINPDLCIYCDYALMSDQILAYEGLIEFLMKKLNIPSGTPVGEAMDLIQDHFAAQSKF